MLNFEKPGKEEIPLGARYIFETLRKEGDAIRHANSISELQKILIILGKNDDKFK